MTTRKETILQIATTFFSEKGFRDTSMKEIAKVTGVAGGTIFYHFKTKEDLFVAVLKNFKEVIANELENNFVEQEFKTGLDMVEGAVSFYLHMAHQMEERFLLLHRHDPYKLAKENTECWQHLEEIYSRFTDTFEQAIRKGMEDGSIRKVAAQKKALLIFTLVDGLVRLETYNLYRAGPLYNELIETCIAMLKN